MLQTSYNSLTSCRLHAVYFLLETYMYVHIWNMTSFKWQPSLALRYWLWGHQLIANYYHRPATSRKPHKKIIGVKPILFMSARNNHTFKSFMQNYLCGSQNPHQTLTLYGYITTWCTLYGLASSIYRNSSKNAPRHWRWFSVTIRILFQTQNSKAEFLGTASTWLSLVLQHSFMDTSRTPWTYGCWLLFIAPVV